MAVGTDDVAFFHRQIMPEIRNCSTTPVPRLCNAGRTRRLCRRRNGANVSSKEAAFRTPQNSASAAMLVVSTGARGRFIPKGISPGRPLTVESAAFSQTQILWRYGRRTSVFRLDIRRDQRGAGAVILIDLRLEVGGPLDKGSGEFRIGSGFGEFEQRRRLTRKICSTQHADKAPLLPVRVRASRGNRAVRSAAEH